MAKSFAIYTHFNTGELSDRLKGRVDLEKYKHGCETLENFIVLPEGGVSRRGGSHYVADVKTVALSTRLIPFQFNDEQAYILEFGNLYFRIYKDNGRVESGGSAVEVTTTYVAADLFSLKVAQSADTMYIAHKSYPPRKITRSSHTSWAIANVSFSKPPEDFATVSNEVANGGFAVDLTSWTDQSTNADNHIEGGGGILQLGSAGSGTAIAEQNLGVLVATTYTLSFNYIDIFDSAIGDSAIGVRIGSGSGGVDVLAAQTFTPGFHEIAFTGNTSANYLQFRTTVVGNARITAVKVTRDSGGTVDADTYPGAVTFYQQRLYWGGTTNKPQSFWASATGDFENMDQRTGDADNALQFAIAADSLDTIQWLAAAKDLLIGTFGSEHSANGGVENAVTPTSIDVRLQSAFGSSSVAPINAGIALLFITRGGKKIREMVFNFQLDGFVAPDLTLLAEHITNTGITQAAYQQDQESIIWCSTSSGELIGMTYLPDQKVIAWHRHPLAPTKAGLRPIVESVAAIPDPANGVDQVWVVVKSTLGGATTRSVQYLDPYINVDQGLTLDNGVAITGLTSATPPVVTAVSHGLIDGNEVYIKGTWQHTTGTTSVNNKIYTVNNKTTNTFELQTIDPTPANVDGTGFGAFITGGTCHKGVNTVSGLDHLDAETAVYFVDRLTVVHGPMTPSSGVITIPNSALVFDGDAGLVFTSTLTPVRPEFGSPQGMTQGKRKRWSQIGLRMEDTLGGTVNGDNIEYEEADLTMNQNVPLFTGDKILDTTDYDPDGFIKVVQDQPLPMTLHAIFGELDVGEIYGDSE